jgi:hypothetical protein
MSEWDSLDHRRAEELEDRTWVSVRAGSRRTAEALAAASFNDRAASRSLSSR